MPCKCLTSSSIRCLQNSSEASFQYSCMSECSSLPSDNRFVPISVGKASFSPRGVSMSTHPSTISWKRFLLGSSLSGNSCLWLSLWCVILSIGAQVRLCTDQGRAKTTFPSHHLGISHLPMLPEIVESLIQVLTRPDSAWVPRSDWVRWCGCRQVCWVLVLRHAFGWYWNLWTVKTIRLFSCRPPQKSLSQATKQGWGEEGSLCVQEL